MERTKLLSHTNKHRLNSYLGKAGKATAPIFGIAVVILSLEMLNAQELNQEQQISAFQAGQFLFVGDVFDATFLQPTVAHKQWSTRQWADEFSRLRQLGTRSLIIQWSKHDEVTFYPEVLGQRDSLLHRVTAAAKESGIDFYIGLTLNSDWSKPQELDGMRIDAALEESKRAATIIHQQFGQRPGFLGWYIPQELTDIFYTHEQQELILTFFSRLTQMLHGLDPLKPVIASGYTAPDKSHLVKFTMWWMHVFDESGIDTLIFQDGAGMSEHKEWKSIKPYLEAISIIDDEYFSGNVWFIAEIFTQLNGPDINQQKFRADSANFDRVLQQLEMLGHFGKKIASYAYFPYMRPSHSESASRLYDKYKEFVDQRVTANRAGINGDYDAQ